MTNMQSAQGAPRLSSDQVAGMLASGAASGRSQGASRSPADDPRTTRAYRG